MTTEFERNLSIKLKEKNLADSTIQIYLSNLRILNNSSPLDGVEFLFNKKKIMAYILTKKETTQRNYLVAIITLLHLVKDDSIKNRNLFNYYNKILVELVSKLNSQEKNVKSDTQAKNWINWDDVVKKRESLFTICEGLNSKYTSEQDYHVVLKMIVLALYTDIPVRRNQDFQLMKVYNDTVPVDEEYNFLSMKKKKFYFAKYKTAKHELKKGGYLEIDIPANLMNAIKLYFKFHPLIKGGKIVDGTHFLVDYDGNMFKNSNRITFILNSIFGKNVGVSMLRHSFLSSLIDENELKKIREREEIAKSMSHSSKMQTEYVKV